MAEKKFKNIKSVDKKEKFLKALEKNVGLVTPSANEVGITPTSFYRWVKQDEEFAAKVQEIIEIKKDFVESKLFEKINDGDTSAIIFASKHLLHSKGYTDKAEIKVEGTNFKLNIETE